MKTYLSHDTCTGVGSCAGQGRGRGVVRGGGKGISEGLKGDSLLGIVKSDVGPSRVFPKSYCSPAFILLVLIPPSCSKAG